MKAETKNRAIWLNLLKIASVFFFIIGFVMVLLDTRYIEGIQYLLTASLFMFTILFISYDRMELDFTNPEKSVFLTLGFIFSVIGLNMNLGIWALGIAFFVTGTFNGSKKA
ncbi:MAG: hypothetical protein ABII71_01980 [Candidatus Micrarchaeota archaeon]